MHFSSNLPIVETRAVAAFPPASVPFWYQKSVGATSRMYLLPEMSVCYQFFYLAL
jgi:hypothetical protein